MNKTAPVLLLIVGVVHALLALVSLIYRNELIAITVLVLTSGFYIIALTSNRSQIHCIAIALAVSLLLSDRYLSTGVELLSSSDSDSNIYIAWGLFYLILSLLLFSLAYLFSSKIRARSNSGDSALN